MGVSLYLVFYNKLLRPTKKYKLLLLSFVFVVYLTAGSYVFNWINFPIEQQETRELVEYRRKFLDEHPCLNESYLNEFIELIVNASNYGVAFYKNQADYLPNWTFGGETLFFTFTLLSTIGYGHISPATQYGKLFCIVYIIVGVPLTILLLTTLVDRIEYNITKNVTQRMLLNSSTRIDVKKYLHKSYSTIIRPEIKYNINSDDNGKSKRQNQVSVNANDDNRRNSILRNIYWQTSTVGVCLLAFVYVLPSYVFSYLTELNWSLLDSIYYIYISISTIGFGDLVPGQDQIEFDRNVYRFLITVYLFLGIITNMLFLNMLIRLPLLAKIYMFLMNLRHRRRFHQLLEENTNTHSSVESSVRSSRTSSTTSSRLVSPIIFDPNFDNEPTNRLDQNVEEPIVRSQISSSSKTKFV